MFDKKGIIFEIYPSPTPHHLRLSKFSGSTHLKKTRFHAGKSDIIIIRWTRNPLAHHRHPAEPATIHVNPVLLYWYISPEAVLGASVRVVSTNTRWTPTSTTAEPTRASRGREKPGSHLVRINRDIRRTMRRIEFRDQPSSSSSSSSSAFTPDQNPTTTTFSLLCINSVYMERCLLPLLPHIQLQLFRCW